MIGREHDIAIGADEEHRHVRHLARHEAEQQHGGQVDALPGPDGVGTIVRITLPLLDPSPAVAA